MNARALCLGLFLSAAIACQSTPASRTASPPPAPGETTDVVRLTNGEVVQGRIVEETSNHVAVDTGGRVAMVPAAAIYTISYSPETFRARAASSRPPAARAPAGPEAPSGWYPRSSARETVEQKEILWYETHPATDCVGGPILEECRRAPELVLFAEPGGRIVFHDPRAWGYHAHIWPGERLLKPAGKPGLRIEVPKVEAEIPEAVAFVSPSQEITSNLESKRTSYAPPDALYARVKPVGQAEAMLASQAFAGGKPAETATGRLWAFSLPRNSTQFMVYLFDAERRHGQILKGAFAAYGETILAPDFMIDLEGADGVAVGRVLVVPFPDGLSADGPAPEPVVVYAGPVQDPTRVATVAVPPRQAVQLPPRTPSTKADVLVSHYEVSRDIPERIVIAYGTGRPTGPDVAVVARELSPGKPDELVKIDVSSLAEERFPAVVWFHHRRTWAWKMTGGYLAPAAAISVPPAGETKLTKTKRNVPIPHVLPLVFQGPKPPAGGGGSVDPAAGVAGGMSTSLLTDSLARESGRFPLSVTTNLDPGGIGPGGSGRGAGGNVSSVTNVTVVVPPHAPAGVSGSSSSGPPGGYWMNQPSTYVPGGAPIRNWNLYDPDTGRYIDRDTGQTIWDPRTPSGGGSTDPGGYAGRDIWVDQGGTPVVQIRRRTGP